MLNLINNSKKKINAKKKYEEKNQKLIKLIIKND